MWRRKQSFGNGDGYLQRLTELASRGVSQRFSPWSTRWLVGSLVAKEGDGSTRWRPAIDGEEEVDCDGSGLSGLIQCA